ncbi:MAG: hypothetical protein Q9206_004768 [Seirophora lacunosa]
MALLKKQIRIVQAALLGSILANLLLILGMSFLWGGLHYKVQVYNATVTHLSACLLSLAVLSLLIPTAFHASFSDEVKAEEKVLLVSRGTAVILLLVYILYVLFQLVSHSSLYEPIPRDVIDAESSAGILHPSSSSPLSAMLTGGNARLRRIRYKKIRASAAEHVTAVKVAAKNKMDLAIGVAIGSSIQIALFVTPSVVLIGWMASKDMPLYFTLFETVALFVATFVVNFLVLDGKSNYLEGALLCSCYIIIA